MNMHKLKVLPFSHANAFVTAAATSARRWCSPTVKSRVSEILVKRIRVNQGVGVRMKVRICTS